MPDKALSYQTSYQEDADEQTEHMVKVEVMTRYTEKMAETHPDVLQDLILLTQHHGRDSTDWDAKFSQHDTPLRFNQAFKLSTADMDDHDKAMAALETAEILTTPLQSKLEDFTIQAMYSKHEDKLDPESHRELLQLTAAVTNAVVDDCRHTLAEAFINNDQDEIHDAINLAAYARHHLNNAQEARVHGFQTHFDPEGFQKTADHREELLHNRFTEHMDSHYPADKPSPQDQTFKDTFREFAQDYLEADVERLARRYSKQTADLTVNFSEYDTTQDFAEAWQNQATQVLRELLDPPNHTTSNAAPTGNSWPSRIPKAHKHLRHLHHHHGPATRLTQPQPGYLRWKIKKTLRAPTTGAPPCSTQGPTSPPKPARSKDQWSPSTAS